MQVALHRATHLHRAPYKYPDHLLIKDNFRLRGCAQQPILAKHTSVNAPDSPVIPTRPLGRTELQVPVLCFGKHGKAV